MMRKKEKTLFYIDPDTKKYTQCKCQLKDEITEFTIKNFFDFLYSMKLDSCFSPRVVFKGKNTTASLVREFDNILNSDVICFDQIMSLYASDTILKSEIVSVPIERFLDMFDINISQSFTENEFHSIEKKVNKCQIGGQTWLTTLKKYVLSIQPNTIFLEKIGYLHFQENKAILR